MSKHVLPMFSSKSFIVSVLTATMENSMDIPLKTRERATMLPLLLSCFIHVWLCATPSGFPVPGILQARTLEWVAISFSNAWQWKMKVKTHSRVWLLATSWTAAYQAPLSMGFSRQEYWSRVPLPSPIDICTHTHTEKKKDPQNNIKVSHQVTREHKKKENFI